MAMGWCVHVSHKELLSTGCSGEGSLRKEGGIKASEAEKNGNGEGEEGGEHLQWQNNELIHGSQ